MVGPQVVEVVVIDSDINENLSIAILFSTFIIGYWWFVRNTGEERLTEVYKNGFN
jgi:hypothetical protein